MILTQVAVLLWRYVEWADYGPLVVVLPDPFRWMVAWSNSKETQQSGHAPRSGPEIWTFRLATG